MALLNNVVRLRSIIDRLEKAGACDFPEPEAETIVPRLDSLCYRFERMPEAFHPTPEQVESVLSRIEQVLDSKEGV